MYYLDSDSYLIWINLKLEDFARVAYAKEVPDDNYFVSLS